MFNSRLWRKVGDNLYLSKSGLLAQSSMSGGYAAGWIKVPERNKESFSYRFRPVAGGPTRRVQCSKLVEECFGIKIKCDEAWYEAVVDICRANGLKEATRENIRQSNHDLARRMEEQMVVEVAVTSYPRTDERRQADFYLGF